jgi:hypothetical protein
MTKRAVLTALVLVASASAAGERVKVTETPDRVFYVDHRLSATVVSARLPSYKI